MKNTTNFHHVESNTTKLVTAPAIPERFDLVADVDQPSIIDWLLDNALECNQLLLTAAIALTIAFVILK